MKIKGFDVSRVKHIGFRDTKEGDLDLEGNQMRMNETAFVYIKNCRIYEKDGRRYYDASEAPAIPTANGGSYYGYGATRHTKDKPIQVGNKIYYEYWTCPVYIARDGMVYTGTCRMFSPPGNLTLDIRVSQAKNIISLLEEVLPYLQEKQTPETIVGRVEHAKHLINYLQNKLTELEPKAYEVENG